MRIERRQLQFEPGLELTDGHVHTHFGYCAVDVHPVPVRERIELLGLKGVACVEHAGQLYLPADDYWRRVHVENPAAIPQARKLGQGPHRRVPVGHGRVPVARRSPSASRSNATATAS